MWNGMKDTRGFTLVEVLIALAIVAVGVIAVTRLFPQGLRASQVAQERTIASELAKGNFARVKMTGLDNLLGTLRDMGVNQIQSIDTVYGLYTGDPNGIITQTTTSISRTATGIDDRLVRVTYSVEMPDGRRENFVTYVTEY